MGFPSPRAGRGMRNLNDYCAFCGAECSEHNMRIEGKIFCDDDCAEDYFEIPEVQDLDDEYDAAYMERMEQWRNEY